MHELKDRKPDDARLTPVAKAATAGIQSYFVDLLQRAPPRAARGPGDAPVNAEIDGVPFAEEHIDDASEVMGLMLVLFLGGVESTAGLVGTLFKLLAENPDQREILRENPALIPDAVEEAIRIATPLQLVGRTTSREVTLHGVTIPAGGRVVLVYGAANRDERRFADPDRFDVTRGKQRHLGFGEGMHGCIGAPLARLEAKIALEEALPLLGDYTITDPPERYRTTPNMYVWEHLHLAFPVTAAPHPRTPPLAHVETAHHHTDTTVVARELETEVRVAAKEEVADGVVALTLRAARRRAAARRGRPARTSTSSSAAGCPTGSTPCAATRPTAPPTGSASCATRTAAAAPGTSTTGWPRATSRGCAGRATTSRSPPRPATCSSRAASASRRSCR